MRCALRTPVFILVPVTCTTYVRTAATSVSSGTPCETAALCANCKQVAAPATDLRLTHHAAAASASVCTRTLFFILLQSLLYVYDMVCTSPRRLLSDYQIGDYYVVLSVSRGGERIRVHNM